MKVQQAKEFSTDARAVRVPARAPRWVVPLLKLSLALTDATLTVLSFVAAFYLRHYAAFLHRTSAGDLA